MNKHNQIIQKPLLLVALIIMAMPLKSQNPEHGNNSRNLEISTGYSYLIYQSGYGFKGSQGMEVLVSRRLDDTYKVETGFRVTLNPVFPEVFVRGNIGHHFNRWQPLFGLETGITKRADFESSSNLLKESREAMLKDVGLMYLSSPMTMGRYWMIGLLLSGFLTFFYLLVRLGLRLLLRPYGNTHPHLDFADYDRDFR